MKILLIFFLLFITIGSNAQNSKEVIVLSQSLREGNGSRTVYLGTKLDEITIVRNYFDPYAIDFSVFITDEITIDSLRKCISSKFNKTRSQKDLDGFQVLIRIFSTNNKKTFYLPNKKEVKFGVEELIKTVKMLPPSDSNKKILKEFDSVINDLNYKKAIKRK